MLALLLALALGAPPEGFNEVKKGEGCVLYKGPTEPDGVQPMRAECHWPEVDPAVLASRLADYEAYDELIFAITVSEVIREDEDGSTLVRQVQDTKGIATREGVVRMRTIGGDDAIRVTWKSEPMDLELGAGHVRPARNEGSWQVGAHEDGGSEVIHKIAYDPGGSVPGWLVRWFQVGGMMQVMDEVRAQGVELTAKAATVSN